MKSTILIAFGFLLVIVSSCSKEDKSIPVSDAPISTTSTPAPHRTFIFSGDMQVEKSDSLWAPVTSYNSTNVSSTVFGTSPDYALSTNFNPISLKGQTNNNISVSITNNYFSSYNVGTGIFNQGVLNGYYGNDSLYYQVLYKGVNKSNVYLTYTGRLTSSH